MMSRKTLCLTLCAISVATAAVAEDGVLRVELNTAETTDSACRLSFLIENTHPADITQAIYEAVLFNIDGAVNQLTLFDFGVLPTGRPRVRQFEVPGLACTDLSRLLINGASTCEADELGADICTTTLLLSSRTSIALLG